LLRFARNDETQEEWRAMTEVLFYHLQDTTLERVLPPLLEKSLARGWRVAVQAGSEERAEALDAHLWTWRDDSFLPHGTWRDADAAEQPVVLVTGEANPNRADVRFIVDTAGLPADCADYQRIVLVFNGDDDEALGVARAAWSDGKARGFEITYWQTDERGRWQQRA
jgi:DNA polymerase-3 subunit chi